MNNKTETKRGCGSRQPDSIYLESRQAEGGQPIEHFIIDPPIPCFEREIEWSRGYQPFAKVKKDSEGKPVLDSNGNEIKIIHLIDWVGEGYYPSPWDFIEEARAKGISRRVNKDFDFSLLTPYESQIFFAHKKARFDDIRHEYGHPWKILPQEERTRITMLTPKNYYPPIENIEVDKKMMSGDRVVGDLLYRVDYDTTLDHSVEALKDGLFLRMYITNIVYVRPSDPKMLEKIKINNFNIEIVDE